MTKSTGVGRGRRGAQRGAGMIPRPYADLPADALADEITVAQECIQTTRDLRKQMQGKLAEEGRRQTHEDLPL